MTNNNQVTYNPSLLLDHILIKHQLKNDAALCRLLEVQPPVISKLRRNRHPLTAPLMLLIHDVTGITIAEQRRIIGDRRAKHRISDAQGKPKTDKKHVVLSPVETARTSTKRVSASEQKAA